MEVQTKFFKANFSSFPPPTTTIKVYKKKPRERAHMKKLQIFITISFISKSDIMAWAIEKEKMCFQIVPTLIIRDKALTIAVWLYLY